MTDKKRYGLIGCGMMGQEHLRNIALLPGAEAGVIFEPDAQMRSEAQALAPAARMVDSVEALLGEPALDALLIASPNHCHAAQITRIAQTRPLPLLVEKPLLTSPNDIAPLKQLAVNYPAPLWVAMEYRYMPPVAAFLKTRPRPRAASKC